MSFDFTTSSRLAPDPQLEQVFTEKLALMRGWAVLATAVRTPGIVMYTRSTPGSCQHYLITDHGIVVAISTRRDICEYIASRRRPA